MTVTYLDEALVLLSAAVVAVPLFRLLGLGAIPGFLIAGAVLGPSGVGYIEDHERIAPLAELGVVLLLFVIGIEINPVRLWRMRGLVFGLGTLQVLVTGAVLTPVIHLFLHTNWQISLLIGLALALSSTALVLQLLTERQVVSSAYGRPSVAILLLQDLAVVPLLALVSLMSAPGPIVTEDLALAVAEAVGILLLIVLFARHILNPILHLLARAGSPEIFTASALLLVLGTAQLMEGIGLSMAMGAFIAGLVIADSSYRHQIIAEVQPFRGLLLGLFFMSMGMSLDVRVLLTDPLILFLAVVGLLVVKAGVLWSLLHLFRIRGRLAWSVALLLSQSGEFALVLFSLAWSTGLMEEGLFQYLLTVVLLTLVTTPFLERLAYRIFLASAAAPAHVPEMGKEPQQGDRRPVIVAGFGRMGHRVGYLLEAMDVPYVAIDRDPAVVERERRDGRSVFYGDVRQPEVLRAAGVVEAPLVIVSIDDLEATGRVVASIRMQSPTIPVFARGHDLRRCRELKALGASFIVSETLEASAELGRAALLELGYEESEVMAILQRFREEYYGDLR